MSFIKLDRKIIDSEVFFHEGQLRFWLWLLMKANYKKSFAAINTGSGKKTVEVGRGQLIFGRNSASETLGVKPATLYIWLQKFKDLQMVELNSNKHFTVITICKYDDYQTNDGDEITSQSQANNKPIANQSQANNTSKEVKEIKEDILPDAVAPDKPKKFIPPTIEELNEYCKIKNIELDAEAFIDYYEARGWVSKGSKIKNWKRCISTWKKNESKFNDIQSITFFTGHDETDIIQAIDQMDEFTWNVARSKLIFDDTINCIYSDTKNKYISFQTLTKCERLHRYASDIFKAKSLSLTPAIYGKRTK